MFLLNFKFFKPRFVLRINIHPEVKGIFGTQKSNASIDTKVSGAMELLEESNQRLAEINEQIESCEKKYAAYESKLDIYKEAEKPIKRSLLR